MDRFSKFFHQLIRKNYVCTHRKDFPMRQWLKRKIRGEGTVIEVYKILHDIYDKEVTAGILNISSNTSTTGHSLKLTTQRSYLEIWRNSFAVRVVKPDRYLSMFNIDLQEWFRDLKNCFMRKDWNTWVYGHWRNCHLDLRRYFSERTVDHRNNLALQDISCSEVNSFKNCLNRIQRFKMGFFMD